MRAELPLTPFWFDLLYLDGAIADGRAAVAPLPDAGADSRRRTGWFRT